MADARGEYGGREGRTWRSRGNLRGSANEGLNRLWPSLKRKKREKEEILAYTLVYVNFFFVSLPPIFVGLFPVAVFPLNGNT